MYFRMMPFSLSGGSQDTKTMEAEAAAALTPAGGPGTGHKSVRSVTEMGPPPVPRPLCLPGPTLPAQLSKELDCVPSKSKGYGSGPGTSEGTSLGDGVIRGAIELKCSC